ncbi:hypothetical protein NicSoilB4_12990 [Arthrobacter sp. NicSoilB4]|uniref:DUF5956 family protein n=1 Tax=Arthrobacter sp. NicSoilB4 TaxID=2830997 RepID=UPI001CC71FF7|nr:DUF5956 family protein [Arthrobacter sp. NicSoilB4]BCW66536.1 hypothetical protein NicSoilB4_12990 [Arthrobacter sp. NicSoilB4]
MSKDPWACPEPAAAPAGWILATENGWGALAVWAAGAGNFVRVLIADRERHGIVVDRRADGSERRELFVLTKADLTSIDDDIDTYLADAGLPPRPRGYDWFIRRPAHIPVGEDAFWGALWAAAIAELPGETVHPLTVKGPVREAMARMYAC